MKINSQQLKAQIKQGLAPVYLIAGDEPLQVQEARDLIVQHANQVGYSERHSFHATSDYDWDCLLAEINQQSLFSTKALIELRINSGKPGKTGAAAIEKFLSELPRDKILLIITPKLDSIQQKSKWVKGIEEKGAFITVWPIETAQLPRWIQARLQKESLKTTPEGIQLLADQTQGNLLACAQEITKLSLLYGEKTLSTDEINEAIGDQARFDLYSLVDQALLGEAENTVRILTQLQESGTEPTLILWAITREIRQLIQLNTLIQGGERFDSACSKLFIWNTRQSIYQSALRRLTQSQLLLAIERASRIDLIIKGMEQGNLWLAFNELLLALAGSKLPLEQL
jgi:DNA polymerase-3 subunit delta